LHVISKSAWQQVIASDRKLESAIGEWHKVATCAAWRSLDDMRKVYPHADLLIRLRYSTSKAMLIGLW
jgi:mRNA-degrading endonuclease HigB of HigAB toxin-antitoxin module